MYLLADTTSFVPTSTMHKNIVITFNFQLFSVNFIFFPRVYPRAICEFLVFLSRFSQLTSSPLIPQTLSFRYFHSDFHFIPDLMFYAPAYLIFHMCTWLFYAHTLHVPALLLSPSLTHPLLGGEWSSGWIIKKWEFFHFIS